MSGQVGIQVNRIFNTSKAANTNLFTDFLQPSNSQGRAQKFRVFCAFDTDVTLTLVLNNGAAEVVGDFNDANDTTIPAGKSYEFTHDVWYGDQVNYRISAAATVRWFYVLEFEARNP